MLPPPEKFTRKHITGYSTDRISIGKHEGSVVVVLTKPGDGDDLSLIFETSPAGARQVAASLLNQADDLDAGFDSRAFLRDHPDDDAVT